MTKDAATYKGDRREPKRNSLRNLILVGNTMAAELISRGNEPECVALWETMCAKTIADITSLERDLLEREKNARQKVEYYERLEAERKASSK